MLSEFDIRYTCVKGEENPVVDALSWIDVISDFPGYQISTICFPNIFNHKIGKQKNIIKDIELKKILRNSDHSLKLE